MSDNDSKQGKREFWFEYMAETKEYQQLSDKPPYVRDNSFELVHLIEYSSYQELAKRVEGLETAMQYCLDQYTDSYIQFDDGLRGLKEALSKGEV